MSVKYPEILTEDKTLDMAIAGSSIARYGDGEWRCAIGGGCTSQKPDPALARELQQILLAPKRCLVCLPGLNGPRRESWIRYTEFRYIKYCTQAAYGAAFITRPDNAPWIDRPDYWAKVRSLWLEQDVVLVSGDKKSITTEMMHEARSIREVHGPRQHAYAEIDRIQREVMDLKPSRVLICLGAAATVLAYRLCMYGIHALDLGHIGMFMRHAGAYRYAPDDLTTPAYRAQLEALHAKQKWGADGAKHTAAVKILIETYHPKTILDYGCGENVLAETLKPHRVSGYDPGITARAMLPKPCELVVCTDVLEHVEESKLDAVLDHLYRLTGKVAYLVISTKLANAILPDGRNAHLSVHPAEWWISKLQACGWLFADEPITSGKDLIAVVRKPGT
jgi:Glycosyltransferase GT-D fold/Methyltransferase domain